MKKIKKMIISTLLVLLFLIMINTVIIEASNQKDQIRIGYFPNITHAPALVGISENIFADNLNGTEIKTMIFPNGSLFMDALNTGQIDIGYVGPGPAMNRYLQGADVKALASASTGGTVMVSNKNFNYSSEQDLKNKIIATPALGCTHDLVFRQFIKDHNLNTRRHGGSIDHRAQNPATMVGLFATNQIDAAVVSEPWAARMETELDSNVILEWDAVPWNGKLPATIIVSSNEYIEKNQDLVAQFLKAHLRAINFIAENPEQSSKIIQSEIENITGQNLSIEVIDRSLARTNMTAELDASILQELADLSSELGFINNDSDLEGFVDLHYLNLIK